MEEGQDVGRHSLILLLALAGASPAAGKDLPRSQEPPPPPRPLVTVPAEAFAHPGSPRTRWRSTNQIIEEYRTPGTGRSDFVDQRGRRIDCYRSFTGRVDCR